MYCPKCGNEIEDDAKFCGKCGTLIESRRVADLKCDNKATGKSKTGICIIIH